MFYFLILYIFLEIFYLSLFIEVCYMILQLHVVQLVPNVDDLKQTVLSCFAFKAKFENKKTKKKS